MGAEVTGAPRVYIARWEGMRRRLQEDFSATARGPKIRGDWGLGIRGAEAKRLSGEGIACKEGC